MKKGIMIVLASFIVAGAGILFQPGEALSQDVNFSFGINVAPPPPAVVVSRPPALYVIPGTPVYYVPQVERQLYFYSGSWYRLYDGYWFRSAYNNGPWAYLAPPGVPVVFRRLSPRYYVVPPRDQYRVRWTPPRYARTMGDRHYGDRGAWDDHHDNHGGRGFEGHKDWDHDRANKWGQPGNWRLASNRHYEYRDKRDDHYDNRGVRGFKDHNDWNDNRSNNRWN